MNVHIYIYIYMSRERERERDEMSRKMDSYGVHILCLTLNKSISI